MNFALLRVCRDVCADGEVLFWLVMIRLTTACAGRLCRSGGTKETAVEANGWILSVIDVLTDIEDDLDSAHRC
jgi:hypothetical protein